MIKRLNFLLTIIFYCYNNGLLAQDFKTVYPKNNQNVNSTVNIQWSNYFQQLDSFNLIINHLGNDIIDTIIKNNKIKKTFSNGIYKWKVFAYKKKLIVDSAESVFKVFNPLTIDSLSLWLKADTGLTLQSGGVRKWVNIIDSNTSATQISPANQPTYLPNVLNEYPVIDFDNSNDKLAINLAINNTSFLISLVYNSHIKDTKAVKVINGQNNWFIGPYYQLYRGYNGAFYSGKKVIKSRFVQQSVFVVNDTTLNYVNDSLYGQNIAAYPPGNSISIGTNSGINGSLAELIILKGKVSDSIRQSIDHYLMDKYAPPINLGADKKVCRFPATLSTAIDYALDYQWSTGDTTASTQVDSAGKYYLTITDMFERTSTDSIYIGLDTTNYQLHFDFVDTTICKGDSVALSAPYYDRYAYRWSTNDSSSGIKVGQAGKYYLTVENCLSNRSTDSIEVKVNQPKFSLGRDTTTCFYSPLTLKADSNFSNVSYLWSNGKTSPTIVADTNGWYALKISDNYSCAYTDSISITIDSMLYNLNLGPDTALCEGNKIGILQPNPTFKYLWSNGDSTASTTVDTAGSYVLQVSNEGCRVSDTVRISLKGEAPIADFFAMDFCFGDSVHFQDLSSFSPNDFLQDWEWNLGDSNSSILQNPAHYYAKVDSFLVTLKVTTDKGCTDTTTQFVKINPKPQARMLVDNHCAKEAIYFSDSSFIHTGNIIGYRWDFGDTSAAVNSSNQKTPSHIYDTLGTYLVQLIVSSDYGCKDTVNQLKRINAVPTIQFKQLGKCLGDSTQLIDESSIASGKIKSYLWSLNNQFSNKQNPKVLFPIAGIKKVTLNIKTDSACYASYTDSIEIFPSPKADFILEDYCQNTPFQIFDRSTANSPIMVWRYVLATTDTSFKQQPTFMKKLAGVFPLEQLVIDSNNCRDSITHNIKINPLPKAAFVIEDNGSGVPYYLRIENNSTDAINYFWDFGNEDSDSSEIPNYTYQKVGEYDLKLLAISDKNCQDSTQQLLRVLPAYLDASVEQLILTKDYQGFVHFQVRIANTGNNAIEKLQIATNINGGNQFVENLEGPILKSRTKGYQLTTAVKPTDNMDFVCINILTVNTISDSIVANNKACEPIGEAAKLYLNLFPNPTVDQLNLEYVLPELADVRMKIFDSNGNLVMDKKVGKQTAGYYFVQFNLASLQSGIYHLSFDYNGDKLQRTFIKK